MVFVNIPSALTEEEKGLLKKLEFLKNRRKAVLALKTVKSEPKEVSDNKKRAAEDAAGNTEQAKKLLKSGMIKVAEKKDPSQHIFKRSKRHKDHEKVSFQPFSPTSGSRQADGSSSPVSANAQSKYKNLYSGFVSSGETTPGGESSLEHKEWRPSLPKRGNTVYVAGGDGLNQPMVNDIFSQIGVIENVNMEKRKSNCFFVRFSNPECANDAIKKLNGMLVSDVHLKVSMARKQPYININAFDELATNWPDRASNRDAPTQPSESRQEVCYDDADDIFGDGVVD